MTPVSALIIARDEAARIGLCVAAVAAWADEVLVVDSGSTDDTVARARAAGARVIETHWRGYGAQKNWAARQARHDWIVSIDADEWPDARLLAAIDERRAGVDLDPGVVYGMRRVTRFCGTWVRHGAWGRDIVWRLYRRDRAHWDERPVHENVVGVAHGEVLAGELLHDSYPDLASHDRKMEPYLALSVESLYAAGQRGGLLKREVAPLWRAFRGYVLQGGWRDGWAGREIARRDYRMVREKYRRLARRWAEREQTAGS